MATDTLTPPFILRLQKNHFIWVDVVPLLVSLAAVPIVYKLGVTRSDLIIFFVMWFLTEIGLEVGHHRYFSHRSFKTSRAFRAVLAVLASINGQGRVLSWTTTHIYHHKTVDQERDPHTPWARKNKFWGFCHAHLFWKWNYPFADPDIYAKELLHDRLVYKISRYYYLWLVLSFLIPGLIAGLFTLSAERALVNILLAGFIRLSLCQHATFLVNSACHLFGAAPNSGGSVGRSRNIYSLTFLTLGGSLHNNHHGNPRRANNAQKFWQLDPGYWVIWTLEKLKIVWDVKK